MNKATTKLAAVLAVVAAGAVGAPGANARPIDNATYSAPASEVVSGHGYGSPSPTYTGPVSEVVSGHGYAFPSQSSSPVPISTTSSGGGFDWGDAGIGAGAMLSLFALGGATMIVRRSRSHETAIS
jgi:hypothetical protein